MSDANALTDTNDETVSVVVTVLRLNRIAGAGKLIALADVELVVDGMAIELIGVRVTKLTAKTLGVGMPTVRDQRGVATPVIQLPPELSHAVNAAVLDALAVRNRLPWEYQ